MKYRWIHKSVDLTSLADAIEKYLETNGFKVKRHDSEDSFRLAGSFRTPQGGSRSVRVAISGDPDDFTIQLNAGEEARSVLKFGSLLSFIGVGAFLLKGYQSEEFYQKLEEEFWTYVERQVSQLKQSATLLS